MQRRVFALGFALAAGLPAAGFDWNLPEGFPRPAVPSDNPMSNAKVELGRFLFYDKRISFNGKESCGSCHRQELAFTDGRAHAEGTTGQLHPRSSMSLANVGYVAYLTWANPALISLEEQALTPMLGEEPVELGLKGHEQEFIRAIGSDEVYRRLFPVAFPGETDPYTLHNVTKAIASFERTIISVRSPYDRYRWGGDPSAISEAAKRVRLSSPQASEAAVFSATGDGPSAEESDSKGGSLRVTTKRNAAVSSIPAYPPTKRPTVASTSRLTERKISENSGRPH